EGLVVLDHFQGNRTPYTDPDSRGIVAGLTLKHGRAHIFRAVLEGIAFGTELIFETMRKAGFAPKDLVICGGATRSDLWLQIHADVCGLPLSLTRVADAPILEAPSWPGWGWACLRVGRAASRAWCMSSAVWSPMRVGTRRTGRSTRPTRTATGRSPPSTALSTPRRIDSSRTCARREWVESVQVGREPAPRSAPSSSRQDARAPLASVSLGGTCSPARPASPHALRSPLRRRVGGVCA